MKITTPHRQEYFYDFNIWMIGDTNSKTNATTFAGPNTYDVQENPSYNIFKPLDGDDILIINDKDSGIKRIGWDFVTGDVISVFTFVETNKSYYIWDGIFGNCRKIKIIKKFLKPSSSNYIQYSYRNDNNEIYMEKHLIYTGYIDFVIEQDL